MKKVLLSLAAVCFALTANAQALNYGFEEGDQAPKAPVTENWNGEQPAGTFNFESTADAHSGSRSLAVITEGEGDCGNWQRVIAFQDLDLKRSASYRVSLWVKGTGKLNLALLQGEFNNDKAMISATGAEQVYDVTIDDEANWQYVSRTFWVPSNEDQLAATDKVGETAEAFLAHNFLRISFKGVGNYTVDDIVVAEATVQEVAFSENIIRVNFGYATNAAELAQAAGGTLTLNKTDVKVVVDEEETEPMSVEIKDDGMLYIFFDENEVAFDESSEIVVSFTNNCGLTYTNNVAPGEPVANFEAEVAYYNEDVNATSALFEEALLLTSNPENNSFEISENITTFTLTYNKNVRATQVEAVLTGGAADEKLTVVENAEPSATITLKRTDTTPLAKGTYKITVAGVANEMGTTSTNPDVIEFEVGKVQVAETIYTDRFTTLLEGAGNGQPTNWSIMVGGENWAGGEPKADNGSACRNLNVTGVDGVERTAFYLCDRDGYTYMQYGDQEGAAIILPAGNVEFSVIALSHDEAGHTLEFRLEDLEGNEIVTANGGCAVIANSQFTSVEAADHITATFKNPAERAAILKVHALGGGYTAVRVLGFRVRTYELTEGDTSDSEIVFASEFKDGNMPAEGSGWLFYEKDNALTPGSGRNGTSGMLERNFHAKMPVAAFFRECGANADAAMRIEYGNGNGVEDGLALAPGSYEIVYYAGTWNDNGGNAAGNSKVFFQLINAKTGTVELDNTHVNVANFENGGACNGQADKVVISFKPSTAANYIIKAWGTTNTVWGALTIEKEGSRAVKYHTLLNEALDLAKAELETAQADERYAGTALNNLAAAIVAYTDPDFHTAHEFEDAIKDLEKLVKDMADRRVAILAYANDLEKLGAKLDEFADTKYEGLEIIPTLQAVYNKYSEIDPSTLENEELLPVQAQIAAGITTIDNVVAAVNNLLTKQINQLLEGILTYGENLDNEFALAWVDKGDNAISDDQAVAVELQKIFTACLYDTIASGYDFTKVVVVEEVESVVADSINITGYIANHMLYTISAQKNYEAEAANASFPGWNVSEGTVSNVWWWENPLAISETNPALNASIHNIGGNAFKVNQDLSNLPVGVYTMSMLTADCSNVADVSTTYVKKDEELPWSTSIVYAAVGKDTVSVEANYGAGKTWRNASETILQNINGVAAAEELTANVTIGAEINCTADAAQVDDTYLYLTGKVEGFDYAAAAAALLQNVPDGIKPVERADAPIAVSYMNLNGQHTAAPQGVSIKIERYSDGYTVVKKVVVK